MYCHLEYDFEWFFLSRKGPSSRQDAKVSQRRQVIHKRNKNLCAISALRLCENFASWREPLPLREPWRLCVNVTPLRETMSQPKAQKNHRHNTDGLLTSIETGIISRSNASLHYPYVQWLP